MWALCCFSRRANLGLRQHMARHINHILQLLSMVLCAAVYPISTSRVFQSSNVLMQMCKCQQANICLPIMWRGKRDPFGPDYFEYKSFKSKVFWFVESCFPEKYLVSETIKATTIQGNGISKKTGPGRWRERASSLLLVSQHLSRGQPF